ncbi:MAG: response regulator transcription factor [Tepidiformaceae bacterium]
MNDRNEEGFRGAVAFVTHTRDYRAADVLPALAHLGYTTTERPHDRETERLLTQFAPDVVVLAVDPRHDDDVALIRLVANRAQAAVLVLAPGPHTHGFAAALEAGADVCMRETDGVEIFSAQLAAINRKKRGTTVVQEDGPSTITVRDLVLDFDRCSATRATESIPLTPTEFKILAYLARNAGKVVSPVEMLRAVQDYTYSDREAQEIVKVYVRRIRRKLEFDPSEPDYIVNVRGFGYMLERRTSRRERQEAITAA